MTPDQRRRYAAGLMAAQYDRATPQDTTVTERAGLLPIGTYANGMTGLAFPGFIANPVAGFIREATNQVPYLNRSEDEKRQAVETGFDVAGAAMVGGLAAPKPSNIVGSAGGKLAGESRPGAAAGAALQSLDNTPGIRAYHGSPHDFDRFDLGKIGTGEGAQAYGHGLYFAENEGVAKQYRYRLTSRAGSEDAANLLNKHNGNSNAALAEAEKLLDGANGKWPAMEAAVRELRGQKENGRLYEVNIKADPNDFLDWNKPLSQQSEKVREAIKAVQPERYNLLDDVNPYEARDALEKLGSARLKPGQPANQMMAEASNALLEAGIPGIRYLDQGSRTAGEGSRNYVVFDDKRIEILRKYGLLGMAGGAAVNEMLSGAQDAPRRSWSNAMLPGDA